MQSRRKAVDWSDFSVSTNSSCGRQLVQAIQLYLTHQELWATQSCNKALA